MNDFNTPIVCLDFDGVICDSIHECLIVAYSAFYNKKTTNLKDISLDIRNYFYKYRHFVAPASDYCIIFQAYEKNIDLLTRQHFHDLCVLDGGARLTFGQQFFDYRDQLRLNEQAWVSLHTLFTESECVKSIEFPKFHVMTTKDRRSVEMLSTNLGFADKILSIYSKEVSTDKSIQFKNFFYKEGFKPTEAKVIFVDDNIDHLMKVKDVGLHLFHASWGYHDVQEVNPFVSVRNLNFILDSNFYDEALKDSY